ncbi:MAG: amidohydrolase family protein [Anaerolineaceae bacterium]|nr:amidohydrolase family protein [Anaerolineaceae bacterium]
MAEYCRLACDHQNVHLDLCLSLSPRRLVERLVEGAGIERIVWGSDALFINMAHQIGKVLGARLSDEQKRAILGGNARRILKRIRSQR